MPWVLKKQESRFPTKNQLVIDWLQHLKRHEFRLKLHPWLTAELLQLCTAFRLPLLASSLSKEIPTLRQAGYAMTTKSCFSSKLTYTGSFERWCKDEGFLQWCSHLDKLHSSHKYLLHTATPALRTEQKLLTGYKTVGKPSFHPLTLRRTGSSEVCHSKDCW